MLALREALARNPAPLAETLIHLSEALDSVTMAQRNRSLLPLERRLRIALSRAFRAQGSAFVRRFVGLRYLYEAAGDDDWDPIFLAAVAETLVLFREPLLNAATDAIQIGAEHAAAQLAPTPAPSGQGALPGGGVLALPTPPVPQVSVGISFNLHNPRVSNYLHDVGGERIVGINNTTRDELRKILGQAASEGWSYRRTAQAISAKYAQFAGPPLRAGAAHIRSRAEMIAITETGQAYEEAKHIVAEGMASRGQPMQKRWIAAAKPCPVCAPNPGVGWIPLAKAFPSGHQYPLGHPGCRCASTTRVAPAKVAA